MRKILYFSLFIISLSACSQRAQDAETVMLLHYFTGNLSQGIEELSTSLNKEQNDVRLIATPMEHEEFKVNIRLQLDSENGPDLFSYWAGARTDYLAERGKIQPIGSLLEAQNLDLSFEQSVLEACSYEGELYMLPLTQHYVGFFYNKEIFLTLNLEEPSTWDELLKVAEKISEADLTPFALGSMNRWPAQFWFDYLLLRSEGFDFREALMEGTSSYTDERVLKVMTIWSNLLERDLFNENHGELTWDQAADLLSKGESAMTLMGTWIIPYMDEMDLGFFPFPQMDSAIESVALGPIDGALLSKRSEKQKSAGLILEVLAGNEAQQAFNEKSGALSPHKGIREDIYTDLQKEVIQEIEKSVYWSFNYDLATSPQRAEAGLDFMVAFLKEPERYIDFLEELEGKMSQF